MALLLRILNTLSFVLNTTNQLETQFLFAIKLPLTYRFLKTHHDCEIVQIQTIAMSLPAVSLLVILILVKTIEFVI